MTVDGFSQANASNYTKGRAKTVQFIVLHYTANNGDTAKGNCSYFSGANRSASAHFFCDESSIWQSVLEGDTAWHCGTSGTYKHPTCRNANSIGIEMCSRKDSSGKYYIKPETVANARQLTLYLMEKYGIPADRVIRHYDVTGKTCPEPWVRVSADWTSFIENLKEDDDMDQTKFNQMFATAMDTYLAEQNKKDTSTWGKDELAAAKTAGITDGTSPQGLVTREQAAIMAHRAAQGVK